jgi:signal transduction histidine kinase
MDGREGPAEAPEDREHRPEFTVEQQNSCEIRIDVRRDDALIRIDYRDNGRGMDEAVRTRIFEPFFTTRRGQGGSGLGMHIVYNLVTQGLRGTIECVSSPGEGVLFRIAMPGTTP